MNGRRVIAASGLMLVAWWTSASTTHAQSLSPLAFPASPDQGVNENTQPRDFFELPVTSATEFERIESPYTLGPGDLLRVEIFNVPEYSGTYLVSVDGTLSVPIIGSFDVENLTVPEATEFIIERFTPVLQQPIVTVSVATPRPLRIALGGEIVRPGTYTVSPLNEGQFPKLSDVIKQAGGLTQAADVGAIQIRRFFQGQERIILVDLWKLLQESELAQDVSLRDGDRIFIPDLDSLNLARQRRLSAASFTPIEQQPIEVSLVGEVFRRGPFSLPGGSPTNPVTVTVAIGEAGGITNFADVRNVEVRRLTSTGEEQVIPVDLWKLISEGDLRQDIILQAGDAIVVPRAENQKIDEAEALATASFAPETISVNIVGEGRGRGTVQIPANTPLSHALISTGGFSNRARRGSVKLVRLNPDGTVTRKKYSVDFDAPIDDEENPRLQNNDTIVVSRSIFALISDSVASVLDPVGRVFAVGRIFNDNPFE
ncbi:periplasmic protein involved in polysaccharide export [Rubidibacter lacunae KORDI 51-2]|uniref:Periplasmic protein involved in polysaccharide export n=1 Tax=Rubidibacter lacunae KORDI 51-2 TaxID=582515 RepID=U5D6T8_9CHRO|nr:polysaccharide biosynthesis/export family protein [Rubidibacter lacunae]ERN40373.1 periplasmic protein involved in polysaccharide export [Rubidibacter lacunae KORDI 51-2]